MRQWLAFPVKSTPLEFFQMFGGVSALFFLALKWRHRLSVNAYVLACVGAGVIGSLYFWVDVGKDAWQSLLHGAIWGLMVAQVRKT